MSNVAHLGQSLSKKRYGGKAANLSRLHKAGLPVPDGIAISIEGFKDGKLGESSLQDVRTWLGKQQNTIYAVRSSGVDEDGKNQSWAGQFETYLDVDGDGIIDKIHACHRGVTERAKAYAGQKSDFRIAVIVQEMVRPDYAGVLFTQNPVDGSAQVVIEYTTGLADQLVSGEVTPENVVIDKEDGTVIEGEKIPFDVKKLLNLAFQIESTFGTPQDIEWATTGGDIYILQARPITTIKAHK